MDTNPPTEITKTANEGKNKNGTTDNENGNSAQHEHVWKGPDGAQKNIQLPIEAIQESLHENDPDNATNIIPDGDSKKLGADLKKAEGKRAPTQTEEVITPVLMPSESKASIKT